MNNNYSIQETSPTIIIKAWGKSYQEMFGAALLGMFQALKPEAPSCARVDDLLVCEQQPVSRYLKLTTLNIDKLLVEFLCESLYLAKKHQEAYLSVDFHLLSSTEIQATFHGVSVASWGTVEIRDVSYGKTEIEQRDGLYEAVLAMIH